MNDQAPIERRVSELLRARGYRQTGGSRISHTHLVEVWTGPEGQQLLLLYSLPVVGKPDQLTAFVRMDAGCPTAEAEQQLALLEAYTRGATVRRGTFTIVGEETK